MHNNAQSCPILHKRNSRNPASIPFNINGLGFDCPKAAATGDSCSTADITVRTQDGVHSATATGNGPFHALHLCLRKCLASVYPQMADVRLTDYKVRVLEPRKGTAAKVRVLIEWSDHRKSWSTVGVSDNVIVASWNALVDAIRLELMRLTEQDDSIEKAVEDYCWGV
jgi:2-isopropylmalate synthase